MRFVGLTHQFLGDVLPEDFRAEIFDLVLAAWLRVTNPETAWLEPRITGLLQMAMIAEQEHRFAPHPPFFICEDVKRRDPVTGKEKERTDIEIHLRYHWIKGQKPYFVFESKRLNISRGGILDSNVHEYIGDGGLGCLLAGSYECVPNYSGMLAYVMDGDAAEAKQAVEKQVGHKAKELLLRGEAKIHSSPLMPKGSECGETRHIADEKQFSVFHIFLPVGQRASLKAKR